MQVFRVNLFAAIYILYMLGFFDAKCFIRMNLICFNWLVLWETVQIHCYIAVADIANYTFETFPTESSVKH